MDRSTGDFLEFVTPRLRKTSSIPYHNSGIREKERGIHRNSRALIVVIPPSTLFQEDKYPSEQPHSNGPHHRLPQGVLMPLFPSLFGQLTAIAREFNFPTTSGLCLYFHYAEGGITLTPRISDESWPTLWSYLSEPPTSNERSPIISGKVDFDIDHRLAKWYPIWISSMHREISEYSGRTHQSISIAHFRGDSRTTMADARVFEDEPMESSLPQQHSAPVRRHVPRKLSLVERFGLASAQVDIGTGSRFATSPPQNQTVSVPVLSTIIQEDEPKTARQDLDSRVKSWRSSVATNPRSLVATGQASLDPLNLPNHTPMETSSSLLPDGEFNMSEYQWTVSSIGPQSCEMISQYSLARVPSVHMANRLEGSVCTTPSVCTSFGPPDYDPASPTPIDCPLPSPDIAHRLYESVPNTPITATSWGAPSSYPPTPRCNSPSPSLDLGERSMFDEFVKLPILRAPNSTNLSDRTHGLRYPYIYPYVPVYPYFEIYPQIPGVVEIDVQPGLDLHLQAPSERIHTALPSIYPKFDLYPPVYPDNLLQIYPSVMNATDQQASNALTGSDLTTHSKCPPFTLGDFSNQSAGYPTFNIYPALYTFFDVHSAVKGDQSVGNGTPDPHAKKAPSRAISVNLSQASLLSNLCPATHPQLLVYPTLSSDEHIDFFSVDRLKRQENNRHCHLSTTIGAVYPSFNLYPPLYPHLVLYPPPYDARVSVPRAEKTRLPSVSMLPVAKPGGVLNGRTQTQCPHFDSNPTVYPAFQLYLPISQAKKCYTQTQYPEFDLYPAIHSVELYQTSTSVLTTGFLQGIDCSLKPQYPFFNIYPAIYPHFDIYPPRLGVCSNTAHLRRSKAGRLTDSELHATERIYSTSRLDISVDNEGQLGSLSEFRRSSTTFGAS